MKKLDDLFDKLYETLIEKSSNNKLKWKEYESKLVSFGDSSIDPEPGIYFASFRDSCVKITKIKLHEYEIFISKKEKPHINFKITDNDDELFLIAQRIACNIDERIESTIDELSSL